MVAIDVTIGIAILFGIVSVKLAGSSEIDLAKGIWLGIILGILGPLALRSPVKKTQINNKEATVGITYVYDLARVNALYALDERFVRLKRRDVTLRRERWQSCGIDVDEIASEFNRHIDDHERMAEDRRAEIRASMENILTLPNEDLRMNGLIKLMRTARFTSLIDEFDSRVPIAVPPVAAHNHVTAQKTVVK